MSNELMNAHIRFGAPCGNEGIFEVAEWGGDMLGKAESLLRAARPPLQPDIAAQWLIDRDNWMKGKS
jgi:hypothetical protein